MFLQERRLRVWEAPSPLPGPEEAPAFVLAPGIWQLSDVAPCLIEQICVHGTVEGEGQPGHLRNCVVTGVLPGELRPPHGLAFDGQLGRKGSAPDIPALCAPQQTNTALPQTWDGRPTGQLVFVART